MPIREMKKVKGKETDPPLAHPFLRATLGINIPIHGATRIRDGLGSFATMLAQGFRAVPLPQPLVVGFAHTLVSVF